MDRRRLWVTTTLIASAALAVGLASMVAAVRVGMPAAALVLLLAAIAAAVVVPLALTHPNVAIVLLIVADLTRLSDISSEIVGIGVFQPLLILAIASLGLGFVRGRLRLRWSPFYLLSLALLAATALSVLVAGGSSDGVSALTELAKDLVYLAIVLVWVGSSRSLKLATATLVITLASLAALSVVQEFALGNTVSFLGLSNVETTQLGAVTLRHSGPESDANFWARSLVVALPLAMSWWALAKSNLVKWAAAGAAGAIGLGLYLTQSRGGLIAATAAVLIWAVMAGRPYIRWLVIAPVALAVLLVIPGVGSRLLTLTSVSSAEDGAGDPSLVGRVGAQRSGVAMFLEQPVLGVGFGEFRSSVPEYQRKLGIQAEVLDAHNLYLEIAAEGGAIGLMTWGLFFGFGLFVALRAWLVSGQSGSAKDRWAHLMVTGVIAGLVAWLMASAFLHAANLRMIFTVLAVGVGLDLLVREDAAARHARDSEAQEAAAGSAVKDGIHGPAFGRLAISAALAVLVLATSSWFILRAAPERWIAERHVVMATGDEADWRYVAYSYDLITRGIVGATYAALLDEPVVAQQAADRSRFERGALDSVDVSTSYAPVSQIITVRVVGEDAAQVEAVAAGIVEEGADFILGLEEPFVVSVVSTESTGVRPDATGDLWRIALIVALGAVLAWGVWYGSYVTPRNTARRARVSPQATNPNLIVALDGPSARPEDRARPTESDQHNAAIRRRTEVIVFDRPLRDSAGTEPSAEGAVERRLGPPAPSTRHRKRIDLNAATAQDLEDLAGVGPVLSNRIVAYREQHGPFRSIDDLLAVKGISAATLARMRSSISHP